MEVLQPQEEDSRERSTKNSTECGRECGTSRGIARSREAVEEDVYGQHEWVHYPKMTADEALAFVNFDSDSTQPQFVMHGAVKDVAEVKTEAEEAHLELGDLERDLEEKDEKEEEEGGEEGEGGEGEGEEAAARREDELRVPLRRRISVEVRLLVLIEREGQQGRGVAC